MQQSPLLPFMVVGGCDNFIRLYVVGLGHMTQNDITKCVYQNRETIIPEVQFGVHF